MASAKDTVFGVHDDWSDGGDYYANQRGYVLEFYHVPSGTSVAFKAYLATFVDNYKSQWDSEDVYGRNDPIETFQNTKRTISLGWKVPSYSPEEARLHMEKCSLLSRMTYPGYAKQAIGNALALSKAPLFKLKFANLIHDGNTDGIYSDAKTSGLLGRVNGFSFSPNIDVGFFDPVIDTFNSVLFPKEIGISCEYTVFHQHSLGWSSSDWIGGQSFPYGLSPSEQAGAVPSRKLEYSIVSEDGTTDENLAADLRSMGIDGVPVS